MAGINADLTSLVRWMEHGLSESGLKLKKQDEKDALGHGYSLVTPSVFLHAYQNTGRPVSNLPSVLATLQGVTYEKDMVRYSLRLTLGVWNSGTHNEDVFIPQDGLPVYERKQEPSYEKQSDSCTPDLATFIDTVSRIIRRDGTEVGIEADDLTFHIVEDDELQTAGFRFATCDVTVGTWTPTFRRNEGTEEPSGENIETLL